MLPRWRVCNVVECFARNSDDVLGNCKVVHALDREWKLLLRPAEHHLSNLTPFWANRNFGADSSGVLAVSILKRKVNIAVRFHFCINDAPRKRIPFFLGLAASICTRRSHSSPQWGGRNW